MDIKKYGFIKQEKNCWVGYEDYLLENINSKYPYYLKASLHIPIKQFLESNNIEHRMSKIVLHRYFDRERIDTYLNDGESEVVYKGFIEDEEDLEFLLDKLGIV